MDNCVIAFALRHFDDGEFRAACVEFSLVEDLAAAGGIKSRLIEDNSELFPLGGNFDDVGFEVEEKRIAVVETVGQSKFSVLSSRLSGVRSPAG